ncbi:hypothetical protein EIP86_006829 [Pleurotus ostreatoroseus]|nr:hypothetical protein EIP86_006829 [Pleurotus ostreatoroseus]
MSIRLSVQSTFRIYRDKPSSIPLSKVEASARGKPSASRRHIEVSSATDKENIHPVTGLPPRMFTSAPKKRKNDVLTTKLMVMKEVPLSPKKRKVSSSSPTASLTRSQKQGRLSTKTSTLRRGIRSRSTTNLLRVDETTEERREIHDGTSLVSDSADARCYELTVIPLADISEAYEASSDDDSVRDGTSTVCSSRFRFLRSADQECRGIVPRS